MTTDEIRERLLSPNWPLTPERFAKAKALAMRSKRPGAFLELIQALPEVNAELIEQAHVLRVTMLRDAHATIKAQKAETPEARTEQERRLIYLETAAAQEYTSHSLWKATYDASEK